MKSSFFSDTDLMKSGKYQTIDDLISANLNRENTLTELNSNDESDQVIIFGKMFILVFFGNQRAVYHYKPDRVVEKRLPGVGEMALGAMQAAAMAAKNMLDNKPRVSKEVADSRKSTCAKCAHFENGRCMTIKLESGEERKGCGCNVAIKALLAGSVCPQGYWDA